MKIIDKITSSFPQASLGNLSGTQAFGEFAGRVISYISEKSSTTEAGGLFFASTALVCIVYRSCCRITQNSDNHVGKALTKLCNFKPKRSISCEQVTQVKITSLDNDSDEVLSDIGLSLNPFRLGGKTLKDFLNQYKRFNAGCVILTGKVNGKEKTPETFLEEIREIARNEEKFPKIRRIHLEFSPFRIAETYFDNGRIKKLEDANQSDVSDEQILKNYLPSLFKKRKVIFTDSCNQESILRPRKSYSKRPR